MNDTVDYPPKIELIDSVTRYLYESLYPNDEASTGAIQAAMPQYEIAQIDTVVDKLADHEIVRLDRRRDTVGITGRGKELYSLRCIPEVVLGLPFCRWKYERAVVHVIVPGNDGGESAGTGFFVDDPRDYVVTNRHVVAQQRVIRVNDIDGAPICDETAVVVFGPEDLDLALIRCPTPPAVLPLRIDWSENDAASALEDILVLGYPRLALHHPALFAATGQVSMYASQFFARKSLVLTRIAAPGCSGGPVISSKGLVIGIVMGDSEVHTTAGVPDTMLCAVPGHYLSELLPHPLATEN
jgi:hypothetical protein